MTFAVPELLQTILKEDCTVEMEPLDVNFVENLITHLHIPRPGLDIDVLLQEGGNIKVEVWEGVDLRIVDIFDLNDPDFIKSITNFLLERLRGEIVKIRFQRRKKDADSDQNKTERSDN